MPTQQQQTSPSASSGESYHSFPLTPSPPSAPGLRHFAAAAPFGSSGGGGSFFHHRRPGVPADLAFQVSLPPRSSSHVSSFPDRFQQHSPSSSSQSRVAVNGGGGGGGGSVAVAGSAPSPAAVAAAAASASSSAKRRVSSPSSVPTATSAAAPGAANSPSHPSSNAATDPQQQQQPVPVSSSSLSSIRLSDNEISAILSLPMDMVTDGGGGRSDVSLNGLPPAADPDDEATRRNLLHMNKVCLSKVGSYSMQHLIRLDVWFGMNEAIGRICARYRAACLVLVSNISFSTNVSIVFVLICML